MENQLITLTSSTETPLAEIAARLGLAMVLGGVIGLDRELRQKAAGLRTHILIALAATMLMIVAFELMVQLEKESRSPNLDALRILEAVTAGVAFLAAGAIIQSRSGVKGLTTGASMWMAGAIGVACGGGFFLIATAATIMAVLVLTILGWVESRFFNNGRKSEDVPDRSES